MYFCSRKQQISILMPKALLYITAMIIRQPLIPFIKTSSYERA